MSKIPIITVKNNLLIELKEIKSFISDIRKGIFLKNKLKVIQDKYLKKGLIEMKNENFHMAIIYLNKSIKYGNLKAPYYLASIYLDESYDFFDYEKAKKYLYISAKNGDVVAQNNLATIYLNVYKDYENAIKWFELSAENGYVEAQSNLGQLYYKGIGVNMNYIQAEKWLKKAANAGNGIAISILPNLYNENGEVLNIREEMKKIFNGIINGDNKSLYKMGEFYIKGIGVETNYKKAIEYFSMAGELGNLEAQELLGAIYWSGIDDIDRNYKKSKYWYEKAAILGSASAELNLGVIYSKGLGVEKDPYKAFNLYLNSAKKGKAEAEYNVACNYQDGKGTEKDEKEAVKWFLKAANDGDVDASYEMAICYMNGIGVDINIKEAEKYLKIAINNGSKQAENMLRNINKNQYDEKLSFNNEQFKMYRSSMGYSINIPESWNMNIKLIGKEKEILIYKYNKELEINDVKLIISHIEMPSIYDINLRKYFNDLGALDGKECIVNGNEGIKFEIENLSGTINIIYVIRGQEKIYFLKIIVDKYKYNFYKDILKKVINSFTVEENKNSNYDREFLEEMREKAIKIFKETYN